MFDTLGAAEMDVSSHLGKQPGVKPGQKTKKDEMVDEFLKMSKSGQVSFEHGGLTKAATYLQKKFPAYAVETVKKYIHPMYKELKTKKDKESS